MDKKNYKNLVVWQRAIDIAPLVYGLVKELPKEEKYALGDQIRRATISIAANIAEGQARQHKREFLQHLSIAKGSLAELHTLFVLAQRLGYLSLQALESIDAALQDVARPLHGLMSNLAREIQPRTSNRQLPTGRISPMPGKN